MFSHALRSPRRRGERGHSEHRQVDGSPQSEPSGAGTPRRASRTDPRLYATPEGARGSYHSAGVPKAASPGRGYSAGPPSMRERGLHNNKAGGVLFRRDSSPLSVSPASSRRAKGRDPVLYNLPPYLQAHNFSATPHAARRPPPPAAAVERSIAFYEELVSDVKCLTPINERTLGRFHIPLEGLDVPELMGHLAAVHSEMQTCDERDFLSLMLCAQNIVLTLSAALYKDIKMRELRVRS